MKEAKKAYREAGASPRFSETEIRQMNRYAELEERASRIKAKEQKKRLNATKKEAKLEKEREARKKAGLPELKEAYIGPSQLRLGDFLGSKQKTDDENNDILMERKSKSPLSQKSPRRALAPISLNEVSRSTPLIDQNIKPSLGQKSPKRALAPMLVEKVIKSTPTQFTSPTKLFYPTENDLDDLIISNTQIEEELSRKAATPLATFCAKILLDKSVEKNVDDAWKKPNLRLTQDPDCCEEETLVATPIQKDDFDCGTEFTDNDLDDLVQNLESVRNVPPKQESKATQPRVKDQPHEQTCHNDDALFDANAPSSQDLLRLAADCIFDGSEISSQDLLDLIP